MPVRAWCAPLVVAAWLGVAGVGVTFAGCGASSSCPASDAGMARDFVASPVIVERDALPARLYALSDVHGGYARMVALLVRWGLIAEAPPTPAEAVWTGGDASLVVIGDLIDKGAQGVEVIDFLRALETSAASRGGEVVVTLGNHEAEFLADPHNSKADAFDGELHADGLDPCVVATTDPRGEWLRSRPLAVRLGDWFFSHAGGTRGRSIADLGQALEVGLVAQGFQDAELVGSQSILEARGWWEKSAGAAQASADALGVAHLVFGHTPDALGPRGRIAVAQGGLLFRIDVGMSPAVDDSAGALLEITHAGTDTVATELRADGTTRELWSGS